MKLSKFKNRVRSLVCALFLSFPFSGMNTAAAAEHNYSPIALASGIPVVDQMNNLKDLITQMFTSVGTICTLIGIAMFGIANHNHDTAARTRAIEFIVGSLIVASAGIIADFVLS